jgi:hypothetical protein
MPQMTLRRVLALSRTLLGPLIAPARPYPVVAHASVLAIFFGIFAQPVAAAVPVHIVKTDLRPLIRAAVESPVQFAVSVPHAVSTTNGGSWSAAAGVATWNYALRVPTAVSLSFHAVNSSLPDSAVLVVRGVKTTTSYRARDLHQGELWSRILPGDALQFELTVAAVDRSKVALDIVSLQPGYRAIGPGVTDHAYYRQLKAQQREVSGNASCVTNYECQVTPSDGPAAAATVGVIVGNLYQCTGTLINNVSGDNTPYLLTARHCESGKPGGGNPGAASSVTVYWDATTACGAALGSLYDPGVPIQTGAQTVVEQQDAWLLLLDESPVVGDAQFVGFDASGGAIQGGYTIHHAEGLDKQFTGWFGRAAAVQQSNVLGVGYLSNFWETVNATGNIGPGASGSGLFDQNNHLVGSLTLGRQTSDPSGYGSCPAGSPPTPNGTNGVADFTSLASVWNSTTDTTSTTGSATLQSILDPNNTGTVVTSSILAANIEFGADTPASADGVPVQLTWSAPDALQCSASGGVSGDGWSGTLAASGSQVVTETSVAIVTYTLRCTYGGGRTGKKSVMVNWVGPTPLVQLTVPYAVWATRPATLGWTSNVTPCSLSGGGLSQSNLAAAGTLSTTQANPAEVTYTLTCGPADNQGQVSKSVQYVTPSLILEPTGTDRILGQGLVLQWLTYADTCFSSGGVPGDGWAGNAFVTPTNTPNLIDAPNGAFAPNVTTVGTYTYTLTCSSGPISLQQSTTVTFENNAPYVTTSLAASSVTYSDSPADYVELDWDSNMSSCRFNSNPSIPYGLSDPLMIAYQAQGSVTVNPPAPGTYALSVTCALPGNTPTLVTSTPVTLTVLPPPPPTVTISINPTSVVVGQNFTISYSSTNALNCAETGGIPGFAWGGTAVVYNEPPSATLTGSTTQAGQYTFAISCNSIDPNQGTASAQAQLTVGALTATLSASPASVTVGSALTLTWSSVNATSCNASGGGANGTAWTGSLATSGSATQTATTSGTFTYEITCLNGNQSISEQQTVTVSAATGGGSNAGGAGGGSHGGGALGLPELALLAMLRIVRSRIRGCRWFPRVRGAVVEGRWHWSRSSRACRAESQP